MAHTVKTCLHGNQLDRCNKCPQPLNCIEDSKERIKELLFGKTPVCGLGEFCTDTNCNGHSFQE